jgi:N-acetylglucosaminyldiphosphoundecaprenol N-acetyl-beta-D-mannosaminyltransferase
MQDRCNVLGVGISPLNLPLAVEQVTDAAETAGFRGFVTVTGVHGVMESRRDPELRRIHNRSFLTTPDGMPMVWLARRGGFKEVSRVYGPDLLEAVFRRAGAEKHRHFLFGGGEGVAERLAAKLGERFGGSAIVGKVTPPFRPLREDEERDLVAEIRRTKPHFLWVGLSTPKQERFMHGLLSSHPELTKGWEHGLVLIGVGAAFDIHAGLVRQAPRWLRNIGLEWLFRLCLEPRRLWRRYLVNNTAFILAITRQLTGISKFPMER